jgi:heme O synthase-like polyprenyltransferase
MTAAIALQLGRVSNLPTIWSNVLAGTVLAGGQPWRPATLLVMFAVSLLYVGGMYLNDAFDRDIDARERPSRPIPAGLVAANTVFAAGFCMLLAGITIAMLATVISGPDAVWRPVLASVALAGAIVFYDWNHKDNALSPFFMGLCRVLAYLTAGYAAAAAPPVALFAAALISLCYLIGLTYIAKQEAHDRIGNLWPLLFLAAPIVYAVTQITHAPVAVSVVGLALVVWILQALSYLRRRGPGDVPRAVVSLIAGISLVDALFLASAGALLATAAAIGCFIATLLTQRWVSGT